MRLCAWVQTPFSPIFSVTHFFWKKFEKSEKIEILPFFGKITENLRKAKTETAVVSRNKTPEIGKMENVH